MKYENEMTFSASNAIFLVFITTVGAAVKRSFMRSSVSIYEIFNEKSTKEIYTYS